MMNLSKTLGFTKGGRRLLIVAFAAATVLITIGVSSVVYTSFLSDYHQLDLKDLTNNANRGYRTFVEKYNTLESKVSDWGAWDEAFELVSKHNMQFVTNNITENVVSGLQISFLAYLDDKLKPITAWTYLDGKLTEVNGSNFYFLSPRYPLIQDSSSKTTSSIVNIYGKAAIAVAKVVSRGDGSGPPTGRVVFVRILDENLLESLSDQTHFKVTLKSRSLAPEAIGADASTEISVKNGTIRLLPSKAYAFFPLIDSNGSLVDTLQMEFSRDILLFGQRSARKIAAVLICLLMVIPLLALGCFHIFGLKNGINDLLKVNETLKDRESYLSALIDAVPGFVSWFDRSLKYLGVNDKLARHFEMNPIDFVGKDFGFQNVGGSPDMGIILREMFDSDVKIKQFSLFLDLKNERRQYLMCLEKYADENAIVVVGIDTTAIWLAETQSANDRQIAINSARLSAVGDMAAGIAHEINNPLAIIQGASLRLSRMLNNDSPLEKRLEMIALIEKTIGRIVNIINGLRNFSRDGEHDEYVEVPIQNIVDEVLMLSSEKFYRAGVTIKRPSDKIVGSILCREAQIGQVLFNLLSNSFDAIADLEERWIELDVKVADAIEITVTDSGAGISDEVARKMMESFFTTKSIGKGTGLGLSISSKIIKEHRGELSYDKSCKNTRFVIRLPRVNIQS